MKTKATFSKMHFLTENSFLSSLNSHQFVIKFVACGIWEAHQMSELAPWSRAHVCASAFCLYTYDYEVFSVYNGELCAHLMLHNPIFVICARGSFLDVSSSLSQYQQNNVVFWKNVKITLDFKTQNISFDTKSNS